MNSNIRNLVLIILLALAAVGLTLLTWLWQYQYHKSATQNWQQFQLTRVEAQVSHFFDQLKSINQLLLDQSVADELIDPVLREKSLYLMNRASKIPGEVVFYNNQTNQLFRSGHSTLENSYLGLEPIILSQVKASEARYDIGEFSKQKALIFSYGYRQSRELIGVVISIVPLTDDLLFHLNNLTGAEFQININNQVIKRANRLQPEVLQIATWPFETKIKAQVQFGFVDTKVESGISVLWFLISAALILIVMVLAASSIIKQQTVFKPYNSANNLSSPQQAIDFLNSIKVSPQVDKVHAELSSLLQNQLFEQKNNQINIRQLNDEVKSLQEQLEKLERERDSAKSAPKTKSEFLSRMGDEITTPMKTLSSMHNLLSEYDLSDEPKELLNIARRSASSLINNLNNILDFSKLDANLLKLNKVQFNTHELIEAIVLEYQPYAKSKSLNLSSSISPEAPETIVNDPTRIKQILKNLIGNAIRFTKQGEVNVFCDLIIENGNQFLRFTVKDTGLGISEEAQKGLFDSLEMRSKLTNSSLAGRLRLIVSKMLAELMGGKIGVKSEVGKGSRFWFSVSMQ